MSSENLISGLASLANHPAWDVAAQTTQKFSRLLDLLQGPDRDLAESALRAVYRPRYDALANATDEESLLLRRNLTRFLALDIVDINAIARA